MFTDASRVAAHLGLRADDGHLAPIVAAVNAWVARLPSVTNSEGEPTPDAQLGATMLAARLHRRRNSPAGIETVTEAGVGYVARGDSDVARLLGIDSHLNPQIG